MFSPPSAPRAFRPAWLIVISLWLSAASVAAEAKVIVQLKDKGGHPADGRVELKDSNGQTVASCSTKAGTCEMNKVPGGSYRVHVTPDRGKPPKPTAAMIPPQGSATLIVNTGS